MMTAEELEYYGQALTPQETVGMRFSIARDELRLLLRGPAATKEEFEAVTADFLGTFDEFYFGNHSPHRSEVMATPEQVVHRELGRVMDGVFDHSKNIKTQVERYLAGEPNRSPASVSRACGFTLLDQVTKYSGSEIKD